ncbi:MAG: hypothetical protein E7470_00805 [Ruminococcaceae bacterium]|nr:hypothetical protein [Oscillospiraceae bacterium]
MEALYSKTFEISPDATDRFDRLKASYLLRYLQEVAGDHSALLGTDRAQLIRRGLFWAVLRHRVQITRLPHAGEHIRVETWPMPTTRTAYPRSTIAYDEAGNEVFRCISLWVLMDEKTRAMVLPGKSGVEVSGMLRGCELTVPGSMMPREMQEVTTRTVRYTDLDVNGHMNNCRYLDWVDDLLPSAFHEHHTIREFALCYLSEIREGETLDLHWELSEGAVLSVEAVRSENAEASGHSRVFSAKLELQSGVL